ncbi:MAG: hypothetical protein HRF40_02230 [Nitrososphaera sp.]|jgi:predicted transcriptional regulator
MKYRSRTEIVVAILEAADGGATKTRIMYSAYLSYAQLKEYLSILLENELVEYDMSDLKYKTTQKGRRFIKIYNEMGGIVSPET